MIRVIGCMSLIASVCPAWGRGPSPQRSILFIAGRSSHAYGHHAHVEGCRYLANCLSALPNIKTEVISDRWPDSNAVFDGVDAVVLYGDGGKSHIVRGRAESISKLIKGGVGLGILHFALMPPTEQVADLFLKAIGAYYDPGWSVNPTWEARVDHLPTHPITRGVKPFTIKDEWYYHMRFVTGGRGVQGLLSVLPPADTLKRPDGPHSNNPMVRKEVLEFKRPQHLAWAFERADGGRGFGFTGGHYHWNWGHDDVRTLMLNAIVWLTKIDIPKEGIPSETPKAKEMQDWLGPAPDGFKLAPIQSQLDEWNKKGCKFDFTQ